MKDRICKNCRYMCHVYLGGGESDECRRYPPVLISEQQMLYSKWPTAWRDTWCGEWKPLRGYALEEYQEHEEITEFGARQSNIEGLKAVMDEMVEAQQKELDRLRKGFDRLCGTTWTGQKDDDN